MAKDRISEFPEELLLQILSLLPTKTVIITCVLSKRWRFLWKMVQKLNFESDNVGNFQRMLASFCFRTKLRFWRVCVSKLLIRLKIDVV